VVPCSTAIGVSNLTSPVDTVCAASVIPSFTLTNLGQTNIYTATIYYELDNGTVQTYSWSGNVAGGQSTIVSLPLLNAAPGNHVITIYCTDTVRGSFTIGSVPVVSLGNDTTQCGGTISLSAGNNGALYIWSTGATSQSITVSHSGFYSLTVTNALKCNAEDTVMVIIDTIPEVTMMLSSDTVCTDGSRVLLTGNPTGGVFSGQDVQGSEFNPVAGDSGNYVINYRYTDGNNCYASDSQIITVEICASIDNISEASVFQIFPNPDGTGLLSIHVDAQYMGKPVMIFDATGRKITEQVIAFEMERLDISYLPAGVYLLQVGEEFKKLVVE